MPLWYFPASFYYIVILFSVRAFGSAKTGSVISTDDTNANSGTAIKISIPLSTQVPLSDTFPSVSTKSVGTPSETSDAPVTTSPLSGLSEEMVIIISTVFAVGGTLLVVIIVVVFFCLKQRTAAAKGEESKTRAGKLHTINEKNKDLNSNYKQSQKFKHSTHSGRKINEGTGLNQKHPHNDIWYGGRMPTGVEFSRSKKYHQQNYFSRNQHHYRNQNSAYCLPYTDPRNVMYYQRYPGSEYSEDMSGYSREGPYRMQQFYPQSYPRQDRYTEDGLERRIGHRRGDYGGYWDNDTLY